MEQDTPRNLPVPAGSVILNQPFGIAKDDENVGQFLDRTISFCKDNRLTWRAKYSRICGLRVECWIVDSYPGFRTLTCPHCGAKACFTFVRNSE